MATASEKKVKTMKASDLFVRCLEAEGVERIFGIPGEENADLMISLMNSEIEFVLCRHEQAAAFIADVYGRLTGKPGVCLATLGPGITNLVTGLADANMDNAPVVAIIGQGSTKRLHKESHQNMDAIAMCLPISKWAHSIRDEETIPEVIRKGFKLAQAEKPGVTVIELPEDIAEKPVSLEPMNVYTTRRPGADHKATAQAVETLLAARNPIILAGNGSIRKRAAAQLRRLAQKTGIPVVNTFMGKGVLPMDDEFCLFTLGLQAKDYINHAFSAVDVVMTVGYDLVEYSPHFWNAKKDKEIIHIDFLPAEIDHYYTVAVDVVSDIADALWQINMKLEHDHARDLPLHDIGKWQKLRSQILKDFAMDKDDTSYPMKPQKILWDVREVMAAEDVLLSDVGVARPDNNVLSISGDAGFMMNVQDLETAVRLGINAVFMVWEDGEYGLIKWKQQNQFNGRHSDLGFTNPDWELLAKAFGMWGREVKKASDLKPTLKEAFEQNGPALIAVKVDYGENMKLTKRLGEIEVSI